VATVNKPIQSRPLRFAVLGHPVAHSRSPRMHAANFAALGIHATYEARDVTEAQLAAALDNLQQDGFTGLNLTIPLKTRALELVDDPTPLARFLGGVNTIHFRADGTRAGDNTDGVGFLASLRESGLARLAGLRVLLLGCGGAGRALALTCAQAGAKAILLANRTVSRAEHVAETLLAANSMLAVQVLAADPAAWTRAALRSDLIVHTTSQGLGADDAPLLRQEAFHPGQFLFDAVYTAEKTPILREAERGGARGINGLGMLVHQGAQAFRIWTRREPDLDAMRRACEF
jgi:shikimate dehydrogenase